MPKFRKKPVVIEAFQADVLNSDKTVEIPGWVVEGIKAGTIGEQEGETFIKTLEGNLHVSKGDWIIKGVNGELYPCKPDIFEKTYDPVEAGA